MILVILVKSIYDYSLENLTKEMLELGQKSFRATQIYGWLYQKRVKDIDSMSDISLSFREILKEKYSLIMPGIIRQQVSYDGTVKLLVELEDKMSVETVLMRYDYGNAVCVSSQVGCNMGCKFCASGLIKKQRDLKPSEMVLQVMKIQEYLDNEGKGERVSHVVIMGSGEPFDNYDNVMEFIKIINEQKGLAIGARHITVSTSGIPDKIVKYSKEGIQVNLAISLHASNNDVRNEITKMLNGKLSCNIKPKESTHNVDNVKKSEFGKIYKYNNDNFNMKNDFESIGAKCDNFQTKLKLFFTLLLTLLPLSAKIYNRWLFNS